MSKEPCNSSYWAWIFVTRSYHRAVIVSLGRRSSPKRHALHLDFQVFHSVIEAMVGQMSHNLFEHQICIFLVGCTKHLFLGTQNAFSLPRSPNTQAWFSNLDHSANLKYMESSNLLLISILITLDETSCACEHSHKQCSRDSIPEEDNLHFPSMPLFYSQAPIQDICGYLTMRTLLFFLQSLWTLKQKNCDGS